MSAIALPLVAVVCFLAWSTSTMGMKNVRFTISVYFLCGLLGACASSDSRQQEEEAYYLATDFTQEGAFTAGIEGPAVDQAGNLYAVNFEVQGTIGKVSPQGIASRFVDLPEGSIGNGIRINQQGELFVADYTGHNVLKIHPLTREISVHAHDSGMNQPNDLAMMKNGTLFASDPNWKEKTGNLWRIDTDGSTHLLERNMGTTNGIEVSPDERKLYVNESEQRNVWVYDLAADGSISNKRLLIQFADYGMDGMRCDTAGNLYLTRYGKGTVLILSPEGESLREVQLRGTKPSNIAFGGPDGKTCYVTLADRGCIERFRTRIPGRAWQMAR